MKSDSITLAGYVVGLASALAGFILTQIGTHLISGYQFRRRLTANIESTLDGYRESYVTILSLLVQAQDALEKLEKGETPLFALAFAWGSGENLTKEIFEHSIHLRPKEYEACVKAYGSEVRITQILQVYNEAVREYVLGNPSVDHYRLAVLCLVDLRDQYRISVTEGANTLLHFAQTRPFSMLDESKYRAIIKQFAPVFPPAGGPGSWPPRAPWAYARSPCARLTLPALPRGLRAAGGP